MAPITIIPKACSCCKGERSSRDKSSNLPLPNILYEGSEGGGGGFAASFKEKGRGWHRGLCRRVVFAGAQGATAPAALKVADCRYAAMLIKSALRDLLPVSYSMISILVISHLRWLFPPLVAGATKGGMHFLARRAVVWFSPPKAV